MPWGGKELGVSLVTRIPVTERAPSTHPFCDGAGWPAIEKLWSKMTEESRSCKMKCLPPRCCTAWQIFSNTAQTWQLFQNTAFFKGCLPLTVLSCNRFISGKAWILRHGYSLSGSCQWWGIHIAHQVMIKALISNIYIFLGTSSSWRSSFLVCFQCFYLRIFSFCLMLKNCTQQNWLKAF